ncbi:MAG: UDP-N-acetylmuramoyl-L-alanine--D-glutamate ligase [Crocinitomicaceae bacterium]|nr:UDP-N-acetylmuramoyl-L-alanine--D-glutamate ligase [Crocinitomicaceae bacterium]
MNEDILILGAGESGVGAAKLALSLGYTPFVSDAGSGKSAFLAELDADGIEYEVGGHNPSIWPMVKTVVKSPGIPEDSSVVEELRSGGAEVISEIEFASRNYEGKVIAITGANGKTTTTSLIYQLLKNAGIKVSCVGNIGTSWAREISTSSEPSDVVVVETSSFQLDGTVSFKPDVAVLLNIAPDHLDRYGYSLENYAKSKWRITVNQGPKDYLVYNYDDEVIKELLKSTGTKAQLMPVSANKALMPGEFGSGLNPENKEEFLIYTHNKQTFTMTIQELALQGKHNLFNSMAAGVTGRILELRNEGIRESLANFEGIEHRLEYVADVNQIRFINDSKATNVNSVWYAMECIDRPIIWIVGGIDKGNDYRDIIPLVKEKVKHMICLGKDNKKLIKTFSDYVDSVHIAESAEEAVQIGYDLGIPKDTVLLSPACASFDLFGSYEERGNKFKKAVKGL